MNLNGIAEKAIELEANQVVVVDRWRRGPGKINLYKIASNGLKQVPPFMLMSEICLRREFKEVARRVRSSVITLEPEDSAELKKFAGHLSQFFDLPILSMNEAKGKHGAAMHLSFDSKRRVQTTFMLLQRMVEIGPRITLSKLVWEVST